MKTKILCERPDWFLAGMDVSRRTFRFVKTRHAIIRDSLFLDGRTPLGPDNRPRDVSFREAFAWLGGRKNAATENRILAHMAFSGSTLMARCLAREGKVLAYREPQILVMLTNLKIQRHPLSLDPHEWSALLRFVMAQMQKTFGEEAAFIKPSNWVNPLLGDIAGLGDMRLVILGLGARDFILANFRGGRDRLRYSLNLLNAVAHGFPQYAGTLRHLDTARMDPMDRILRLLVVLYGIQAGVLGRVADRKAGQGVPRLTLDQFRRKPEASLLAAAETLDLPLTAQDVRSNVEKYFPHHAKNGTEYDAKRESRERQDFLAQYGRKLDEALAWWAERSKA